MSPLQLAREIEAGIARVISPLDMDSLPLAQRKVVSELRNLATDVRLDARDYDYAETRAEQQALVRDSRKRLKQLQQHIVSTNGQHIFGAVDVAHLSALIEQLTMRLQ
jgi:hypothetical protein